MGVGARGEGKVGVGALGHDVLPAPPLPLDKAIRTDALFHGQHYSTDSTSDRVTNEGLSFFFFFFLIKKASSQVPGVTVDQVRSKIQISAKPGYAYGLQLVTVPPWFPIEVGVVMSVVFPTHSGPSAFCGVSVAVVTGLPNEGLSFHHPWQAPGQDTGRAGGSMYPRLKL